MHADGTEVDSKKVTKDDDWKYAFTNLPQFNGGKEIIYTVTEDAVKDYTTVYSDVKGNYDITNKYTPGKTSVTVEKVWNDANNQDGIRPLEITVKLLADGKDTGKTLVLNEANKWEGDFKNLDAKKAGKDIAYTIEEVKTDVVTGEDSEITYAIAVSGNASKGFTVTNTHTPLLTSVEGIKIWNDANNQDGKRPTEITVRLYADGTEVNSKTVTEEENWRYAFTNLPKFKAGKEIVYTVTEDPVKNYTAVYSDVKDNYDITNKYTPGKTSVTVEKVWEDKNNQDCIRPLEITVRLLADDMNTGMTLVLNDENNWKGSFTDLDVMRAGHEIVYTIEELKTDVITGTDSETTYAIAVSGDATEGFTVTNTHTPEPYEASGEVSFEAKKVLEGSILKEDAFRFLLKDESGETLQTKTNTADGRVVFDPIPLTLEDVGKTFVFTISEVDEGKIDIIYDEHTVTLTVGEIEDAGDGTIRFTVETSGSMVFKNRDESTKSGEETPVPTPTDTPTPTVTSTVTPTPTVTATPTVTRKPTTTPGTPVTNTPRSVRTGDESGVGGYAALFAVAGMLLLALRRRRAA